jgi:hypothetical protein
MQMLSYQMQALSKERRGLGKEMWVLRKETESLLYFAYLQKLKGR